jgi:hypothetical protein
MIMVLVPDEPDPLEEVRDREVIYETDDLGRRIRRVG